MVFDEAGARVAATIPGAASKVIKLVKCILRDNCSNRVGIERLKKGKVVGVLRRYIYIYLLV